ncbi:MAG: hypothetical protein KDA45_17170, partial [Planctomycetales bacterium]|nr:hypothetical protein [Planctomycetales bacterium]
MSPADSEDLHRRIQLSQDAGNLLKRIGAVTKSPQGLAPPVLGNGLGADPNSMAEYLDDALQHAQVPELERVCLVSDVQLAELADCHELLSTALHTKVVVPAELRRQAIAIGDPQQREEIQQQIQTRSKSRQKSGRRANQVFRHDAPHATGGGPVADAAAAVSLVAVEVQAPMVASGGESIKPQGLNLETSTLAHEVPEYLMGSRAGNWRIPAAIGGLLALLGVLIWQMLGPWDGVRGLFDAPGRLAGGVPAAGASNREALQPDPLLDEPIVE